MPPTRAWNTWNTFGCEIDEGMIMEQASKLGQLKFYPLLVVDDCMMAEEREGGKHLVPDPVRFPTPISELVKGLEGRGLFLGMYTSMGTHTCEGLPASLYHQDEDAATFASWGITFLKVDTCGLILSQVRRRSVAMTLYCIVQ